MSVADERVVRQRWAEQTRQIDLDRRQPDLPRTVWCPNRKCVHGRIRWFIYGPNNDTFFCARCGREMRQEEGHNGDAHAADTSTPRSTQRHH